MTPLLILVLGTAPTTAIGTDLAYAAVTKTVGGWRHWRRGSVDMTIALWLAVGSIPARSAACRCCTCWRRRSAATRSTPSC